MACGRVCAWYSRLRREARPWTASADRTVPDLVGAFGQPSLWRPGYNPLYPVSVAYVPDRASENPLIAFDFWQDTDWTSPPCWRPRLGPEPMLRNVRWRTDTFADGFTFSPSAVPCWLTTIPRTKPELHGLRPRRRGSRFAAVPEAEAS